MEGSYESTVGDHGYSWSDNDNYKENYHYISEHLWDSLTKPEEKAQYDDDEEEVMDMRTHSHHEADDKETDIEKGHKFEDLASDEDTDQIEDSHIEYSYDPQVPQEMMTTNDGSNSSGVRGETKYGKFIRATEEGKWNDMKEFLKHHPEAVGVARFYKNRTALHHAISLGKGWEDIAKCLVKWMGPEDLKIRDQEGYTPLALAANYHSSQELLKCMIDGNPDLPELGKLKRIPVIVASKKGFLDTTRYLYTVTSEPFLGPEHKVGVQLLIQCINIKLFDIATDLVERFDEILYQKPADDRVIYPIHAFARTFSDLLIGIEHTKSSGRNFSNFGDCIMTCGRNLLDESRERKASKAHKAEESVHIAEARKFLTLVCKKVSTFDVGKLRTSVYEAMIEAAMHGNIEFITEMLKANLDLLSATNGKESMFSRAIMYRQEKVFNLIYGAPDYKDELLTVYNEHGNILHCAAKLPEQSVLDRVSGPALQMQREIQWFQAVWDVAKPRYRGDTNRKRLTPRAFFTTEHKELGEAGQKSMKKTALAATTVAALIVTTMFATALTVTSGVNQKPSFPTFQTKSLFNTFIVFDTLSLFSSTTSILVFLGILASPYSQQHFLRSSPRRFMIGFYALFCSIATMMVAFGFAMLVMLEHELRFIVVTIFLFSLSFRSCFSLYLYAHFYVGSVGPRTDRVYLTRVLKYLALEQNMLIVEIDMFGADCLSLVHVFVCCNNEGRGVHS